MNNGVGNGIPGPGGMANPNPGINRGFNPPAMTPPVMNPNPPVVNANPPISPVPPAGNILPITNSSDTSTATSSDTSASETKPSTRKWVIAAVVGSIVIGLFVLLGGTFLVIYTVRNSGSSSSKRRRRRRVDDDD